MSKIPIWSWRHAIMKTNAPQAAKHLCHVIACDLSDTGKFTRLSVAELSDATGISERSISRNIAEAEAAGLLTIERVRDDKGHVIGTRYHPKFPANFELATLSANLADRSENEKPIGQNCIPIGQNGCSIKIPSLRPLKKEARAGASNEPSPTVLNDDRRTESPEAQAMRKRISAKLRETARNLKLPNGPEPGTGRAVEQAARRAVR